MNWAERAFLLANGAWVDWSIWRFAFLFFKPELSVVDSVLSPHLASPLLAQRF